MVAAFNELLTNIKEQRKDVGMFGINFDVATETICEAKKHYEEIFDEPVLQMSTAHAKGVFGTRHVLTKGSVLKLPYHYRSHMCANCYEYKPSVFDNIVKDAVISAPDHKDMVLSGLHIIEQADNLFNPRQAD